jgi:hypothetical protein
MQFLSVHDIIRRAKLIWPPRYWTFNIRMAHTTMLDLCTSENPQAKFKIRKSETLSLLRNVFKYMQEGRLLGCNLKTPLKPQITKFK